MRSPAPSRSAPVVVVGLAVILLLTPYPGSLSVVLYGVVSSGMWRVPGIDVPAIAGIVALATLLGGVLVHAWRRDPDRFNRGAAAAAGAPAAYLASETLKLVFEQERPCRVMAELPHCPPIGDWSLPSNHSTVAFALFCAVAVTRGGWLPWVAAMLAVVVGWARIAEGVHYPHDVAAGVLLGIVTAGVAAATLARPVADVSIRVRAKRGRMSGARQADHGA